MGKKGGDSRVKRQLAPTFWAIKRKEGQFVMRVNPGPHPRIRAYPLGMVLRDVLRVASTGHEVDRILKAGKVKVDGRGGTSDGPGIQDGSKEFGVLVSNCN